MRNVLIVYHHKMYPMRPTIRDALYSFERYSGARCYYVNTAIQRFDPQLLKHRDNFDAIIYHTTFLSSRWDRDFFQRQVERVRPLKDFNAIHVAFPQDEFVHTDLLCDFFQEFNVKLVYSLFKSSEWPKMYPTVDFAKVEFHQILAGYLEQSYLNKFDNLAADRSRPIDIGYRAWHAAYWLGRHGQKKVEVAQRVQKAGKDKNLVMDISTRDEDAIAGNRWFDFLLDCKCCIGVEGGSSIIDSDGSIKRRTEEYLKHHPNATFEETEKNCFFGLDESLEAYVITPRHLECVLTRTCQLLLEGDYNGILRPDVHYIEIKKDYSNLDSVLERAKDPILRQRIVEQCYRDIALSDKYTYQTFVARVFSDITRLRPNVNRSDLNAVVYRKTQLLNRFSCNKMGIKHFVRRLRRTLRNVFFRD